MGVRVVVCQGHLLRRAPFDTNDKGVVVSLEYVMEPKSAAEGGGQGLCVYLVDPSVEGWDRHFDGSGPLGFVGKKGAILGVGIDCTGTFCEGSPASIAIKRASDCQLLCEPVPLEGGVVTRKDEFWRKVVIKFDIEANTCDVTIGGRRVLTDVSFEGVKIPRTVCAGVCAGTSAGRTNHICVNKLKLREIDVESGVPPGCIDYQVQGGKLVSSKITEQVWRCAGDASLGYGFELTQDVDDQEVRAYC